MSKKAPIKSSPKNANFEPTKVAFLVAVVAAVSIVLFALMAIGHYY